MNKVYALFSLNVVDSTQIPQVYFADRSAIMQ